MSNTSTKVAEPLDRQWPAIWADDELRLQWEFLAFLRITVVNKIAGLDPARAAATPLPASPLLSLTGIVKHLISVERWWLSIVGGASDLPDLWADGDPDTDFRLTGEDTPARVVAAYRAEWGHSEWALAGMAPGDAAKLSLRGEDRTVRWLLTHLIQETARHVGHMDVLRELADGTRGE